MAITWESGQWPGSAKPSPAALRASGASSSTACGAGARPSASRASSASGAGGTNGFNQRVKMASRAGSAKPLALVDDKVRLPKIAQDIGDYHNLGDLGLAIGNPSNQKRFEHCSSVVSMSQYL